MCLKYTISIKRQKENQIFKRMFFILNFTHNNNNILLLIRVIFQFQNYEL